MASHSSTLAWKIPWTEEPGRLQSMGSLRVRHDWTISLSLFTFMHWRRKWQPTPVFLPGECQGQRSLVGGHLWGCTESDTTEATYFSPTIHFLIRSCYINLPKLNICFQSAVSFLHVLHVLQSYLSTKVHVKWYFQWKKFFFSFRSLFILFSLCSYYVFIHFYTTAWVVSSLPMQLFSPH